MKKVLVSILIAAFFVPAFVGCKKGAEDPGLSLSSRNKRLIGEWELVSVEGTYQDYSGGTMYTTIYSYDNGVYTSTTNPGSSVFSGSGTFTMTIAKDGIYSWTETFTPNGLTADITSGEGFWYWFDNDNSKIAVYIDYTNSWLFGGGIYDIVELSSKEIKLHTYWKDTENGETEFREMTYTFENQD
jgi:hypothetical protein